MNQPPPEDQPNWLQLKIIAWAMFVIAPAVYLAIAWAIDAHGIGAPAGNELMLYILLVVAMVEPAFAPIIERYQISAYRAGRLRTNTVGQFFFTVSIMKMALAGSTFVYGMVAFFITGRLLNLVYIYPIGIIWSFGNLPRRAKFDLLVEKLNRP